MGLKIPTSIKCDIAQQMTEDGCEIWSISSENLGSE